MVLTFLAPNSLPFADGAVKILLTHSLTLVMIHCHHIVIQPLLTINTQQLIVQSKKLAMPTECQYTEQIQPLHYKLLTQSSH